MTGTIGIADKLGLQPGMVVQELGWEEDADDDVRAAVEERCGNVRDEHSDEVIDATLLWWRDGDGDLGDELLNVITPLADDGVVWVLAPKMGHAGHVDPSEIAESASPSGLASALPISVSDDWNGTKLTQPKTPSKQR